MRKILLGLAVVALTVPVFADHFNKVVKVGDKAPDFSGIPAVSPSGEQSSLSLSDLKEDVVVLVFLANHCPYVLACDDRIIDFANDYKDKSVKLVAVSVNDIDQDRLPGIKQHMKDKKLNYTYGYDESQAIRPRLWCEHHAALLRPRQGAEDPLHRRHGRQRLARVEGHQALSA